MELDFNQAVFTTKYITEDKSIIVYVVHDKDEDWQFFGSEKGIDEKDGRVISLGEVIRLDPTIKEILWIPAGTEAWRANPGSEWTTGIYSE